MAKFLLHLYRRFFYRKAALKQKVISRFIFVKWVFLYGNILPRMFNQVLFLCNVPSTTAALQAEFYLLVTLHNPTLSQGDCKDMVQEIITSFNNHMLTSVQLIQDQMVDLKSRSGYSIHNAHHRKGRVTFANFKSHTY